MRFAISSGWRLCACLLFIAGVASASALADALGDVNRNAGIDRARQDCHSPDKNDADTRDHGLFGREAGPAPDCVYADNLRSSEIIWKKETLDKWLTRPRALAPGAKAFLRLQNPQDRSNVIAYLKERAK